MDLVTGAFGNTGRAISERLLAEGRHVRTLTNHPGDGLDVEVLPFAWDDPATLRDALAGVGTFYNTFWMRVDAGPEFTIAVERSTALLEAAAAAGVERIVHISVLHADHPTAVQYPYFAAKARVESVLAATGVPHAVIRPAMIFGGRAPMLEALARILRAAPVFGIAGDGQYRVRPVHVDDVARLCVEAEASTDPAPIDAVGPERPTFEEFVTAVRDANGASARLIHLPPGLVLATSRVLGTVLRDDLLTADELHSTIDGLADTDGPATGAIAFSEWLAREGSSLGS